MLPILILFSSCETLDNLTESIKGLFSGDKKTEDSSDEQKGTKISTPKYKRENIVQILKNMLNYILSQEQKNLMEKFMVEIFKQMKELPL